MGIVPQQMRKPGEIATLDFGNPTDVAMFAEIYGGQWLMETKLPRLYEFWRRSAGAKGPRLDGCFIDDAALRHIHWDSQSKLLTLTVGAALTETSWFVDELIELRTATGKVLHQMRKTTENTRSTEMLVEVYLDLAQLHDEQLEIDYLVCWADTTLLTLKGLRAGWNLDRSMLMNGSVTGVHLDAPIKAKGGNPPIILCYNRKPQVGDEVDYIFDESFNPTTGKQKLMLPLTAWVEFADNSDPFVGIDVTTLALKLNCEHGVAKYVKSPRSVPVQSMFTAQPDAGQTHPNGFTIRMDPDWLSDVPSARLPIMDRVDIYFRVEFLCASGRRGSVEISSTLPQRRAPYQVESGWLQVLWGCLAQGSRVMMADGSDKYIEDMRIGDIIRTINGIDFVRNIFWGREGSILVLQTEDGEQLRCTPDHPVYTDRGLLPAGDITAADKLMDRNQNYKGLRGLWTQKGECTVYNLELERQGSFFAQGIAVGDNNTQYKLMQQLMPDDLDNPFAGETEVKREIWSQLS